MPNLYKLFKYISFLFAFLWRVIKRPICGECSGIRRCLGKAHSPRCLHSHRINMSSGPNRMFQFFERRYRDLKGRQHTCQRAFIIIPTHGGRDQRPYSIYNRVKKNLVPPKFPYINPCQMGIYIYVYILFVDSFFFFFCT